MCVCIYIYVCVCIYIYVFSPLPQFLKGVAFPSGQSRDLCHMKWALDLSPVPCDGAARSTSSLICKREVACLPASQELMRVRTCCCNLPGREMPPRHLWSITERSPSAENCVRCSVSGRAVLLLVCAIVSKLGGLLCPFSRATGAR